LFISRRNELNRRGNTYTLKNGFINITYMINSKVIVVYTSNDELEEVTINKKNLDEAWRKIKKTFTDNTNIEDIKMIYEEYGIETTGIREIED